MGSDTIELTEDGLPATFAVGERTYRIHSFKEDGDGPFVNGHVLRERGLKLGAAMGEEDGQHILKHQDEIPKEYRGRYLAFPNWPRWNGNDTCLGWINDQWVDIMGHLGRDYWRADDLLVSRVK